MEMDAARTQKAMGSKALALGFLFAVFVAVSLLANPAQAAPTTFTVDSTADTNLTACDYATANDCTLRGAINAANGNGNSAEVDTIEFEIPATDTNCVAGVCTITPATNLPTISQAVTINGYSQTGASANTLATGNDAALKIELNGTNRSYGLSIVATGGGSTVRGLVINRVSGDGILVNSSDNVIAGNFIGTDATGNTRSANGTGINIATGADNLIGGTTPAARNVISGNGSLGNVRLGSNTTPTGTVIRGNHIGPNASGTAALLNQAPVPAIGVSISGANDTVIGGSDADDGATDGSVGARNVISSNSRGIQINPGGLAGVDVDGLTIAGNFIGVDATGLTALGNLDTGVSTVTASEVDNLTIGGTAAGAGNVISGNFLGIQGGSLNTTVQGNFVGTDLSGTSDLGNTTTGVHVALGG
ncbi:MAG: beta strand repeat-containing protein, partial [Rubrobacteraceae bacterium]